MWSDLDWWWRGAILVSSMVLAFILEQIGWSDAVVKMLVSFVGLDMVIGLVKAWWTHSWDTQKFKRGLRKWLYYGICLVVIRFLSQPWGVVTDTLYSGAGTGICVYIALVEAISILLNIEAIGKYEGRSIPGIAQLADKLTRWKETADNAIRMAGRPSPESPDSVGGDGPHGTSSTRANQAGLPGGDDAAGGAAEFLD